MMKASVSVQQNYAVRNMTTASCARHKHELTREDSRGIWHETLKTLDQPTTKTQTLDPLFFEKGPLFRSQKVPYLGQEIGGQLVVNRLQDPTGRDDGPKFGSNMELMWGRFGFDCGLFSERSL